MKLVLTLLCILLRVAVIAQPSEQHYPNGNLQWTGSYKTFRTKSTYGHDLKKVKNGAWQYFYEDGTTAMKAFYKAKRSGAMKKKTWEFYTTDGQLIKKEYYRLGAMYKEEFYNTGVFNYQTDSFRLKQLSQDTMLFTYFQRGEPYSEIVVNNGKGVYTYSRRNKDFSKAYEVPALADDGFKLKDTGNNFIGNYSFELSKNDGYFNNEILSVTDTFIHHWYSATGTPDYFRNMKSEARTGDKFCGIRVYSQSEYLEYMENQLKQPLLAGHKYCSRVYFRLNPASGLATDAIGFKFDTALLKFYYRATVLPVPDIINKPGQILTEKSRWMQLTGLYTAKGGERFFTVGGFKALGAQNAKQVNPDKKQEAYYVIDDVFVWEVDDASQCPCNTYTVPDSLKEKEQIIIRKDTTQYQVGKTFIIKNIFFDIDKSELLPKSFIALDSLVELLYTYPTMEIEVSGHTDNTGTVERNTVLSMERAQAVVNYLSEFGIDIGRLTFAGYAANQPIDTNETVEGRQNNRRVQFKIIKM
jgi:OmpA-OmpF porin, OOP family